MTDYRGKCPICSAQLEQFKRDGIDMLRCSKEKHYVCLQSDFEAEWRHYENYSSINFYSADELLRKLQVVNRNPA